MNIKFGISDPKLVKKHKSQSMPFFWVPCVIDSSTFQTLILFLVCLMDVSLVPGETPLAWKGYIRQPVFDSVGTSNNVTSAENGNASLKCSIKHLGEKTVSWYPNIILIFILSVTKHFTKLRKVLAFSYFCTYLY